MLMLADFDTFGQEIEVEGVVWVTIVKCPGPYVLAVRKSDPAPAQSFLVDLNKPSKIVTPNAK